MVGAYVFDVYGTLLDVHAAVHKNAKEVGEDFQAFSDLWRSKQLEYSWVRTLMGAYADFWQLTQESLGYAFAKFPSVDQRLREPLLEAYLRLDCHENVPETLRTLKQSGVKIAVLSNGSPAMLETAIVASGLEGVLDALFSIDAVHHFKTHPLTYAMAAKRLNLTPGEIAFVSSNRWDIAGAGKAGFQTIWLNRAGLPDEYIEFPPSRTIQSIVGLTLS